VVEVVTVMRIHDKHSEHIVLVDSEGVAEEASPLGKLVTRWAHVFRLRWRPKIEVSIFATFGATIYTHLNIKVLDDDHLPVGVRVLEINDMPRHRICGYARIVPSEFPAVQSCKTLADRETSWRRIVAQASFPNTETVVVQLGLANQIGKMPARVLQGEYIIERKMSHYGSDEL
jgi:hypothetical protein